MSNNYREKKIFIFDSAEDCDVWETQGKIAMFSSAVSDCDSISRVGDRCFSVSHDGNVKTANISQTLKLMHQIINSRKGIRWIGYTELESHAYEFNIENDGLRFSFDSFPLIMADDDDDEKLRIYSSWAADAAMLCNAADNVKEEFYESYMKRLAGNNLVRAGKLVTSLFSAMSLAKNDEQLIGLHGLVIEAIKSFIEINQRYLAMPEEPNESVAINEEAAPVSIPANNKSLVDAFEDLDNFEF